MYIGMSLKFGLPAYNCKRCSSKGLVNKRFLSLYEFTTGEILEISTIIPFSNYTYHKIATIEDTSFKLNATEVVPLETPNNTAKIDYLTSRVGSDVLNNISDLKLILSVSDFLRANAKEHDFKPSWVNKIEQSYIGFLNHYNNKIVFRKVPALSQPSDNRFYVMTLTDKTDTVHYEHFYNQNVKLDLNRPVTINMCEGIFDAINLNQFLSTDNSLTIAVLNKDYLSKIEFFYKLFGVRIQINCYLDSDHIDLTQFSGYLEIINIYYNKVASDYGDIKSGIVLTKHI